MGNELEHIDGVILPTIMVLHQKGYFADHCSSCHFYDFGTALTPTCFIVFDEQVKRTDLPEAPQGFNYEVFDDDRISMRKKYVAASRLDLHEQILSTGLDLLRWSQSIENRSKGDEDEEEDPRSWDDDRDEPHGRMK
jgi:hypothetical protein